MKVNSNEALILQAMETKDPSSFNNDLWFDQLAAEINGLIIDDFEKLVRLLYRMDVNELQLKTMLKDNPNENAGKVIARLIVERQLQKIKSRQENSRDDNISSEEAW